jgi:quercetin dioxygenase-like cupin family protein
MRGLRAAAVVWILLLTGPAGAQTPPAPAAGRPVRVVIASGRLPSVVETPLHFRLIRITLGAGQSITCGGPNGMLYVFSGGGEGTFEGEKRSLKEGSAVFLPGGQRTTLSGTPGAPAALLLFLLAPPPDLATAPCDPSATVAELYRSPNPIQGLKPGPHEFTMTRVSVEKGVPRPPMHHRTGAALYYTLAGSWTLHRPDASEPRTRGAVQFEPHDFIHTWENTGDTTGVLLQANISSEGAPEIVFLPPR